MDESIRYRLTQAEDLFFSAMSGNDATILAFDKTWSKLQSDIGSSIANKSLMDETIALAHTVASRVAILATGFYDIQVVTETLTTSFTEELNQIFSRLDISVFPGAPSSSNDDSDHALPVDRLSSASSMTSAPNNFRYPPYIKPSYNWLLANLHNPYPSSKVREVISCETHCPRKDIDGWFIDARKRIGWNLLRKTHFSNKRTDIVDAATSFFVKADDKRPLDSNLEVAFAQIQQHAIDLYSEKFSESTLAVKLDVAVRDMTPAMKAQAQAEGSRRRQLQSQARIISAVSSYPSPERSPDRSSSPLDDEPVFHSYSEPLNGRKRRGTSESSDWEAEDGPRKRLRYIHTYIHTRSSLMSLTTDSFLRPDNNSPNNLNTSLPSPAPSSHEVLDIVKEFPPIPAVVGSAPVIPVHATSSRKRRLSETDIQGLPTGSHSHPRLHAVSDPAPSIENWFQNNFALSNAESNLDVQLFDYSTLSRDTGSGPPSTQVLESRKSSSL